MLELVLLPILAKQTYGVAFSGDRFDEQVVGDTLAVNYYGLKNVLLCQPYPHSYQENGVGHRSSVAIDE